MRLFSFWGNLHFEVILNLRSSSFGVHLNFEAVLISRLSSFRGPLHFGVVFILRLSLFWGWLQLMWILFWGWLYFGVGFILTSGPIHFEVVFILRSFSFLGHFHLKVASIWIGGNSLPYGKGSDHSLNERQPNILRIWLHSNPEGWLGLVGRWRKVGICHNTATSAQLSWDLGWAWQ